MKDYKLSEVKQIYEEHPYTCVDCPFVEFCGETPNKWEVEEDKNK